MSDEKPKIEILVPPNVKMTAKAAGFDVSVTQMPVEEMCLEDMPRIDVDLGDLS